MKIIAMVGDSHTWGEGVGAEIDLYHTVKNGDLRMTRFIYPNYVNLLRNLVNAVTGSQAKEWEAADLASAFNGTERDGIAAFDDGCTTLSAEFQYARLFVRVLSDAPLTLHLTLDGKVLPDITFSAPSTLWNVGLFPVHFFAETEGPHIITIQTDAGALQLYRLECYSGEYAVVNCAVGSCPVAKYLDLYYDRYITPMKPFGVLFEGCTINDWLTKEGPQAYADLLRKMLDRLTSDGARVVCHTVFPVDGAQTADDCPALYSDYIEVMRTVSREAGIPLVDCYSSLRAELDARPEEKRVRWLYDDCWHPNSTGHNLYANEIFPTLARVMLAQ